MTFLYFLSWFATFNNILFFSTGIVTCRKIIRENSTENVPHLPFLMTAFCCFMWTMYGIAIRDSTISFVNIIGVMLQCSYLVCHFIYSKKEPVFRHVVYIVLFTVGLLAYMKMYITDKEESVNKMGLACVIITIVMFASPLGTVAKIFETRSTETLSFPLSLMTVINGTSWMAYGFLINDSYVVIPNLCGLTLGLIQIVLFCIFPNKSPKMIVSL